MRSIMVGALCAIAMAASAKAEIREEPVTYTDGSTTMKGFVVYDDATKDKRPGIIMVHEWWGMTPHSHSEARKFAQQGYTAFIADMYGDAKTADNPKDAGALAGSVMKDPKVMESSLQRRAGSARQASLGQSPAHRCRRLLLRGRGRAEHGAGRRRPRRRCGLPRIAWPQYPGASTGNRQSEDPHLERRGRSLREERAVRGAQEGL